jgi:SpoVK/Ycf46/Vps4 family AAA+-type ATPase
LDEASATYVNGRLSISSLVEQKQELPEFLRRCDSQALVEAEGMIVEPDGQTTLDHVVGLDVAKEALKDSVTAAIKRPEIFLTGIYSRARGYLLYGPPGTGKTQICRAVANLSRAAFFSISASSITSKWIGEAEKRIKAVFAAARYHSPSIIFFDEVDSMLTRRSSEDNEASRRIKTEFLVATDGMNKSTDELVLFIGATNLPFEIDEAALRRFESRVYVPLPGKEDRKKMIHLFCKKPAVLGMDDDEIELLAQRTRGYSGSDLNQLVREAANMNLKAAVEQQGRKLEDVDLDHIPPITLEFFMKAMERRSLTVTKETLEKMAKWQKDNAPLSEKVVTDGAAD